MGRRRIATYKANRVMRNNYRIQVVHPVHEMPRWGQLLLYTAILPNTALI